MDEMRVLMEAENFRLVAYSNGGDPVLLLLRREQFFGGCCWYPAPHEDGMLALAAFGMALYGKRG